MGETLLDPGNKPGVPVSRTTHVPPGKDFSVPSAVHASQDCCDCSGGTRGAAGGKMSPHPFPFIFV